MSRFIADHLPDSLLSHLAAGHASQNADRAIVVTTIDELGWPHPAMLSSLEVIAIDARNIRIATRTGSRTTRNLKENGKLTLVLADANGVFYIKGDARLVAASLRTAPELVAFNMRVDSVLEDNPVDYEQARITTGIRVERAVMDETRARAILHALVEAPL